MNNDIFDAIFGYYVITLGAGAFTGVRSTLRGVHGASAVDAGAGDDLGDGDASDTVGTFGERGRRIGKRAARRAQTVRRSRAASDAADVAGWVSGVRFYRAAQRGAAGATERVLARRDGHIDESGEPANETPSNDPSPAVETAPTASAGTEPTTSPTPVEPEANTDRTATDDLDALLRAVTDPTQTPAPAATVAPGEAEPAAVRPVLFLVPPLKEYPPMPSADITDLESLLGFTKQAAGFAGMESEDAMSASLSTTAASEFAGETAKRVVDETGAVEMAIATMTVLGVDAETTAAYGRLHETGGVYRELAAKVAAGLADLAALTANMAGAASNYHEAAVAALDVVEREQMPHAEAAQATGHSGADGHFYGVASTHHQPLPASNAGALPAGS